MESKNKETNISLPTPTRALDDANHRQEEEQQLKHCCRF